MTTATRDPMTTVVLAVGHQLDVICSCPAAEPDGEATDPNTGEHLPHHYDCAAVEAWPVVAALIAAERDAARADVARLRAAVADAAYRYGIQQVGAAEAWALLRKALAATEDQP